MTKKKWTPGPWGYAEYYSGARNEYGVGPSEFDTVAHVRHGSDDIAGSCKANAALIAAAPDLYEALKRMESHFRMLQPEMDEPGSVMFQARAALKKARGEA